MSFSIGIVGLPNVGKSTLFKALTKKQIDIANYPFCTISPNVGVVKVPDARLEALGVLNKSEAIIPTTIEFVDIAGLVKGAHEGEGLGNQFLAHIREVDAIMEVVRVFEDENIIHVDGAPHPTRDVDTINLELIFADLASVEKRLATTRSQLKSGNDKGAVALVALLERIKAVLENGKLANTVEVDDEEAPLLKQLQLLTSKPIMYALNRHEGEDSVSQEVIEGVAKAGGVSVDHIVTLCAQVESELAELSEEELKELGMVTGLDRLIVKAYEILKLQTYFTSGPKETRAWTIPIGAKAPQAAGAIHSDFEKGFIRAEIINWKDLVDAGSEAAAKEKGKIGIEGKDYVMKDGDCALFRFAN